MSSYCRTPDVRADGPKDPKRKPTASAIARKLSDDRGCGCHVCSFTGITPMIRKTGGMPCEFCSPCEPEAGAQL